MLIILDVDFQYVYFNEHYLVSCNLKYQSFTDIGTCGEDWNLRGRYASGPSRILTSLIPPDALSMETTLYTRFGIGF